VWSQYLLTTGSIIDLITGQTLLDYKHASRVGFAALCVNVAVTVVASVFTPAQQNEFELEA